jgi:hypothetical protein
MFRALIRSLWNPLAFARWMDREFDRWKARQRSPEG